MPTRLASLPTKPRGPRGYAVVVNAPWRYLSGAHESVQAVLTIFDEVHVRITKTRKENRGTLRQEEQELLRAALVLTSSGLDASMHKLVRVALPRMIANGGGAKERYNAWLREEVGKAGAASKAIVDAVVSKDATTALIDAYVDVKTAASYQGTSDLSARVRDLLCLSSKSVKDADIGALDAFFKARNAIVHDMDYENTSNSSLRKRHTRSGTATLSECDRAFQLCARMIEVTATRF